jgi:hypothetical protein
MTNQQPPVKTINYKGKPYVEVAERVKQVHAQDIEFQILESEPLEVADRVIWRVTISVAGKIYKGSAEAKLKNAVPKSADDTNPFECAETSAVGRALAFAGLGTVDGIASYDEIARGQSFEQLVQDQQQSSSAPTPRQPAQPKSTASAPQSANDKPEDDSVGVPVASEPLLAAAKKAKKRAYETGAVKSEEQWLALLDNVGVKEFKSGSDIAKVNGKITEIERALEKQQTTAKAG